MKQVDSITVAQLSTLAEKMYGSFVKAVVDLKKQLMVIDAEMHVDEEQYLLEHGSSQSDLWGINLKPEFYGTERFIEFDSMINIRPRQGNMSRGVEDKDIQKQIISLVDKIVSK